MVKEHDTMVRTGLVRVINQMPAISESTHRDEIIKGLLAEQKYILPKYFYDAKGSRLFEAITQLKEYYPTRTEYAILSDIAGKLPFEFINSSIVELGSGDPSKISILFRQLPDEILRTIDYYPVDISRTALENAIDGLSAAFPLKSITGIVTDFFQYVDRLPGTGRRMFCFFGSTIGNFSWKETEKFMTKLGKAMKRGDSLLLGLDMLKEKDVLEAAYNDSKEITSRFNKNILQVVNGIIGSDFCSDDFEHLAFFNSKEGRIEMHLEASRDIEVVVNGLPEPVSIRKGETIHTENSHKYDQKDLEQIAKWSGLRISETFTDPQGWFSLAWLERKFNP